MLATSNRPLNIRSLGSEDLRMNMCVWVSELLSMHYVRRRGGYQAYIIQIGKDKSFPNVITSTRLTVPLRDLQPLSVGRKSPI